MKRRSRKYIELNNKAGNVVVLYKIEKMNEDNPEFPQAIFHVLVINENFIQRRKYMKYGTPYKGAIQRREFGAPINAGFAKSKNPKLKSKIKCVSGVSMGLKLARARQYALDNGGELDSKLVREFVRKIGIKAGEKK